MDSSKGAPRGAPGKLRIIGGLYRSRRLRILPRPGLRPTPDRVRETLFNWLGQDLTGLACLDLFAGTGALGFEAASRGARKVVMVERDREARAELEHNRATLGAAQVSVTGGDAEAYLAGRDGAFDVVFLDPPFRQNVLPGVLAKLPSRLVPGARVYVESDAPVDAAPPWTELKRGRAGQVSFQLLRWDGDDPGGVSGNL